MLYKIVAKKNVLNVCILCCFLICSLQAQNKNKSNYINKIESGFNQFTISKQFVYSNDIELKEINEVLAADSLFHYTSNAFINAGVFNSYNWVKINVLNQSDQENFIFEFNQTYIDSLQLFVIKNQKIIKSFPKKGLHFSENNNPSFFSNKYAYTYSLNIAKNDTISLYISAVVNDGAFRVMNKIWIEQQYETRKKDIKVRTSYLLFFGGFTTLVIMLSLAMFFFSKKRLYLYYIGFVFVVFLNLVILRHFFSPLYVEKYLFFGNNFSEMFGLLQAFFVLQYANHFFSLKKHYPKLYRIIKFVAAFTIVFFVLALFMRRFEWFYKFSYYFGKVELLTVTIGLYIVAIKLSLKKEVMAYYFIIAYLPLAFFVGHFILTALKLTTSFNPLEWEFVIFVEIFVLTIAMAHRYYLLIKENIEYQHQIYSQRLKISRDLHDNIGSQLTFIISSIDNLKYGFDITNSKLNNRLKDISSFTRETIYELRDTIWAMNKSKITFEDLQVRISNFIDRANLTTHKTKFDFNVDNIEVNDIKFTSIQGMNIYRIIQEAINNAIKYAEAKNINVKILRTNKSLCITIVDDGVGFDINKVELGNGLNNMKKRAKEINAEIDIKSVEEIGTTIKMLRPINT